MEKFNRTLRGYDPVEVNNFLDQVIKQVEKMVDDIKKKDARILELEEQLSQTDTLRQNLEHYKRMESSLRNAIEMAQKASDQIKLSAHSEREVIIDDAKRSANRIVNEALLKAEKTEQEADNLKRNINIFKRRIKDIIEAQLEVVDDIDNIKL
ncbi:MAG: DivIVA domain-containing protein [Bacilli bacterium]|nr:DivIVA domain-containing protein [Bacilli bacterium]